MNILIPFKPQSPDPFINKPEDMGLAKFGHLNALREYVAGLSEDAKSSVRGATTANINLSTTGLTAIDGITPLQGQRWLVKDQTSGAQNGIYIASSGVWKRATDANENAEVTAGMSVFVSEGTANADTVWTLFTNDPIIVGTTVLVFGKTSVDDSLLVHLAGTETITGNKTFSGTTTFGSPNIYSNATGITAFAGGGQASATAITKEQNNVTTVATAGDSVKLFTAVAGKRTIIKNNGANTLAIFPITGGTINGGTVNASISLVPGASAIFIAINSTDWETINPVAGSTVTPSPYSFGVSANFAGLFGGTFTVSNPGLIIPTGDVTATSNVNPANTTFGSGSFIVGPTAPQTAATLALYNQLNALVATNAVDLSTGDIGDTNIGYGLGVFVPGVYKSTAAVSVVAAKTITLSGVGDYVFNIADSLTTGASVNIVLTNGAVASRVFFVVGTVTAGSSMTTGATNTLKGNFILGNGGVAITIGATNSIEGRLQVTGTEVTVIDGTASGIFLPLA